MNKLGQSFGRYLLAGVALAGLTAGLPTLAEDATVTTVETVVVEETTQSATVSTEPFVATSVVASDMVGVACEADEANPASCRAALTFTPNFDSRISGILAMDDSLEISAYEIGNALREQRDLLVEFDALYRSTAALVVRLVNLRASDRAEISELRILRANLSRNLELSQSGLSIAQSKLTIANDELRLQKQLVEDRDIKIAELKAQMSVSVSTNEQELVRLRIALQDSEAANVDLTEQLNAANARIAELEIELAAAIKTRDVHIRALAQEQSARIDAEDALAEALAKIASLEEESRILHLEREGLSATIADQANVIEELRSLLISADSGSENLAGQLTLIIEERDQLLIDLDAARAERDEAQESWRLLFVEVENKQGAIDLADEKITDLSGELKAAETQIKDLTKLLDDLQSELDAERAAREAAEDARDVADNDAARYLEDLQLRDAAILILQQNLADAQELILTLRQDLDAALAAQDDLQDKNDDLRGTVGDRDATIAELEARLSSATNQLGDVSINESDLSGQLAQALATIEVLTTQVDQLKQDADAAQKAYDDLQARCSKEAEGATATNCPVIDDTDALDPTVIVLQGDDYEAQLRAALMELELVKSQPYVRVENVAAWLTEKMVGREDQTAIEFEPRRFSLLQDLLFDTNSADLKPEGEEELRRLSLILRELEQNPGVRQQVLFNGYQTPVDWVLQVAGHADPRPISGGPFADNWELASERALTVLRYLEDQGVSPDRLQSASYGDKKLVQGREFDNDINRRISFTVGIR